MPELNELYQEVILDHSRSPRNCGELAGASHSAKGHNLLCGDRISVHLKLDGDVIADVRFEGSGCAISKAAASMMTQAVKGKSRREAEALFEKYHKMVTAAPEARTDPEGLGKLAVFSGVREFPVRVKCATLSWHTLRAAFDAPGKLVSTE
jgi:nitrogen fixation NifU-like protein